MQKEMNQLSATECYEKYGFAVIKIYSEEEEEDIRIWTESWIYKLFSPWIKDDEQVNYPLCNYHQWFSKIPIDHRDVLTAKNRHTSPPEGIYNKIVNEKLLNSIKNLLQKKFKIWDEGLGEIAFRIIRPSMGDGYPFSRKEWGPAKSVLSVWKPIIGRSSCHTLCFIPGSHLKEYEKYLPENTKFTKDEYRLVSPPDQKSCFRPRLEPGEVIIYHPKLIHTEDVTQADSTRINLELRIQPLES